MSLSSSAEESENELMPKKRLRFDPSTNVNETNVPVNDPTPSLINDKQCSICKKIFKNEFNQRRHEQNLHKKNDPSLPLPPSQPTTSATSAPLSPAVSSPVGRRTRNAPKKTGQSLWNILQFDSNATAKRLRDEGLREQQAQAKKHEALRTEKINERRQAIEERRKVLAAKNALAEENERRRRDEEEMKRNQSEKAISNLIETRKRRR